MRVPEVESNPPEIADVIREMSTSTRETVEKAAWWFIGAVAGLPAANWVGAIVAAEFYGDPWTTSTTSMVVTASVGFGVVVASTVLLGGVIRPLVLNGIRRYRALREWF